MSLTQYYTATSLDGYIADPDNSLGWLFTRKREPDGPLNYEEFIAGVGALAMGSTTYEWILDHESRTRPGRMGNGRTTSPAGSSPTGARRSFPAPGRVHKRGRRDGARGDAAAAGERNIWIVGGGDLAGQSSTPDCWTRCSS